MEKFENQSNKCKKWIKAGTILLAAILAVGILGGCILFPMQNKSNHTDPAPDVKTNADTVGSQTESEETQPDILAPETAEMAALKQLYRVEPYRTLLPAAVLEGYRVSSVLRDEEKKTAKVQWKPQDGEEGYLTVEVRNRRYPEPFADPKNPMTYELRRFYEDGQEVSGIFYIGQVKKEIANNRIYTDSDGVCHASIAAVCGSHVVCYRYEGKPIDGETLYTMVKSSPYVTGKTPDDGGPAVTIVPDACMNYSMPTLDFLYHTQPYADILPQQVKADYVWKRSYLTEYDPIWNTKGDQGLSLVLHHKEGESKGYMELGVSEAIQMRYADIHNPDTYDIRKYYQKKAEGKLGNELPDVFGAIRADDFTKEIAAAKVYTVNGKSRAELTLVCGNHKISYFYVGDVITGDDFYTMVTSSTFFE